MEQLVEGHYKSNLIYFTIILKFVTNLLIVNVFKNVKIIIHIVR